jgi:glycosyltransferase involved in cell wall biosynthesis
MELLKAIAAYAARAGKMKAFIESQLAITNFEEYDVAIYCYWNFEYALAASLLKQKYPIKTIVRTHSLDLYFDRVPENYHPFRRQVYLNSNLFLFISEQGQQYFFQNHHIPVAQQAHSLVNRIGTRNSLPQYKHDTHRIVLLSNAWIQPLKRIDMLVKALALIDDIEVEWIHVGDDYGTGRFPALKKLAADYLDTKPNIKHEFVGRKTLQQLYEIYTNSRVNLFINLSTTEGTPVSMMGSISFGVPVIGTSVGGVPEIVTDGINGLLIPAEINEQDVADKIKQWFYMSDEEKNAMSANAHRIWADKFDADKNSRILIDAILRA